MAEQEVGDARPDPVAETAGAIPRKEPLPAASGPLVPQPFGTVGRRVVIVGLVVVGAYLVVRLGNLVSLLLVSALLAYLVEPAVDGVIWLAFRGFGRPLPRWAAILAVFLWLGSFLLLGGWLLLPMLIEQATELAKRLPEYYEQLVGIAEDIRRMSRRELPPEWRRAVEGYLAEAGGFALGFARRSVGLLIGLFTSLLAIVLVPVLTYFMLQAAPGLRASILAWFPSRLRPEVDFLVGEVNSVMFKFLRGRLIVAAIVGTLVALGTWLIGVPYPLILGLAAGLLDLIPFVGPVLAAVPAIALALLEEPSTVIWVALLYVGVQQLEQIVLGPKIEGGELELNPAVVIVAAVAAGTLFGFLGVLLAIPITALARILLLYLRAKLRGEAIYPVGERPEPEERARADGAG